MNHKPGQGGNRGRGREEASQAALSEPSDDNLLKVFGIQLPKVGATRSQIAGMRKPRQLPKSLI